MRWQTPANTSVHVYRMGPSPTSPRRIPMTPPLGFNKTHKVPTTRMPCATKRREHHPDAMATRQSVAQRTRRPSGRRPAGNGLQMGPQSHDAKKTRTRKRQLSMSEPTRTRSLRIARHIENKHHDYSVKKPPPTATQNTPRCAKRPNGWQALNTYSHTTAAGRHANRKSGRFRHRLQESSQHTKNATNAARHSTIRQGRC